MTAFELTPIPPEDEALRPAIRAFLAQNLPPAPPESRAKTWMGFDAAFSRALGAAGFLGLTLPPEYGGHGRNPFARFVVLEELLSAGAPVAAHWFGDRQSAPLLLRFGTEAQRQVHIPAMCRGEQFFCIGMSEPGSGSDLASVRSRAVPLEDGGWRVDGEKIWTSHAHQTHFMIALMRTSGNPQDRHGGLSQILVDLSLPGITIRPIPDLAGDEHFCQVHFDGVDLPPGALIGAEGEGWAQVTAELALERSGPERIFSSIVVLDMWANGLRRAGASDAAARALGRMIGELAVLRAMSLAVTGCLARGKSPVNEAALIKDLGTSFEQRVPRLILDLLAEVPDAGADPDLWRTLSFVLKIAPAFSLRGGTREVLRGLIARGLGLKR